MGTSGGRSWYIAAACALTLTLTLTTACSSPAHSSESANDGGPSTVAALDATTPIDGADARVDATGPSADGNASPNDAGGPGDAGASLCDAAPSLEAWPDAAGSLASTTLDGGGTYSAFGQTWTYQLVRLPNAAGGSAYAEWMPRLGAGAGPAMVVTVPYDGIDWSGEAIDAEWASRPNAAAGYSYPDVNGPDGSMASPSISYQLVSPTDEMSKLGFPSFLNDMGVLLVYGRFYAGGSIETYVGAMQAGMRFLAQQPSVDPTRVGVFGASWGGFEAAYAAAYGGPGVVPAVAVPLTPALDFDVLATHATTGLAASVPAANLSEFQQFYDPYLRRIFAATGGPPAQAGTDYAHYTGAALCSRLETSLLIPQDDWDTLIPVGEARAFVAACPCRAEGLWYQHLDAAPSVQLSHGPIATGVAYTTDAGVAATGYPSAFTFTLAFMYARLLPSTGTTLLPYGAPDMLAFLQSVHAWQAAGRDVSYVVARLVDVVQPNVQAYDETGISPTPASGAAVVAGLMAQVWPNAGITAANVLSTLQTSGLPLP